MRAVPALRHGDVARTNLWAMHTLAQSGATRSASALRALGRRVWCTAVTGAGRAAAGAAVAPAQHADNVPLRALWACDAT